MLWCIWFGSNVALGPLQVSSSLSDVVSGKLVALTAC